MLLAHWLKSLYSHCYRSVPRISASKKTRRRRIPATRNHNSANIAAVESLEDRTLLSTIQVNSAADNTTADDGFVTLREAIIAANTHATTDLGDTGADGPDTIVFSGGDFADATPDVISILSSLPKISEDLTIQGLGVEALTIDAGGAADIRIFDVGTGVTASFSGLTLTGGHATNASGGGSTGGAIRNLGGTVSVMDSVLSGNSAGSNGGAIDNTGTLTISGSTILSNYAASGGGGLRNSGTGTATIVNSTFSANRANIGGGITQYSSGLLRIINSTIAQNSANVDSDGVGGGIYFTKTHTLVLHNSIVAENQNFTQESDVFGEANVEVATESSNNLIGVSPGVYGISDGDENSNQIGSQVSPLDPQLGMLADNGGPTLTYALMSTSPAMNAGDNSWATVDGTNTSVGGTPLSTDQRGLGFPRINSGTVDIGAFESPTPSITATVNGDSLDVTGTTAGDHVTISFDGTNVIVNDGVAAQSFSLDTDLVGVTTITFNGGDGNDTFTVDTSLAASGIKVVYDGGNQTGPPGDTLTVTGTATTLEYLFADEHSGSVRVNGSSSDFIIYSGLEPVVETPGTGQLILTYSNANDTITVDTQAEIVSSDLALRAGGSPAVASTTFAALDNQNGAAFANGDQIDITGTDTDGSDVSTTFTITDTSTLGDLLLAISSAFTGATASLNAGVITLTADTPAFLTTPLALKLTSQAGNSGNTDSNPLGEFSLFQQGGNVIDSSAGESFIFDNPSVSLTINGGDGDDSISINNLLPGFSADLIVDGQTGTSDLVNIDTNLNLGTHTLTLKAETIQQAGGTAIVTSGLTTLDAGTSGSVKLNNTGNDFGTVAITNAGSVIVQDSSAIDFGASNITGTLDVTAGGTITNVEAITDSGNITVGGTATFVAGTTNDITLDETGNAFSTVKITSAQNATLVNGAAIVLDTANALGDYSVTANGSITEATPTASLLTVGGNLLLNAQGDVGSSAADGALDVEVTGTVSATATGSDIYLTSDQDLTISQLTTADNHSDTIDIRTTNNANLTLTGTGGYTNLDDGGDGGDDGDNVLLVADGGLAIQTTAIEARSFDLTSNTGSIDLDADVSFDDTLMATANSITVGSSAAITGTGDLTFTADDMDLQTGAVINVGTNGVTLKQRNNAVQIDLGFGVSRKTFADQYGT